MSEPQTEYETDTDPGRSSAPWEAEPPDETGLAHVWASDGDLVCSVTDAPVFGESAWERARLIAAAGTAADEIAEMGYDPQKAVEALPELLRAAKYLVGDSTVSGQACWGDTPPTAYLSAKPSLVEKVSSALAWAEGSRDE